jgi:hypothetical protein
MGKSRPKSSTPRRFTLISRNKRRNLKKVDGQTNPTEAGIRSLIMTLLHSVTNTHVLHLQTTSYAEHKALEAYYTTIDKHVDSLVEAYQGVNEVIRDYPMQNDFDPRMTTRKYMRYLRSEVDRKRDLFPGTDLQNILDTITELIDSTLYKLKLK